MFSSISFRPTGLTNQTRFGCKDCQKGEAQKCECESGEDKFDPTNVDLASANVRDVDRKPPRDYAEDYEPTLNPKDASMQAELVQDVYDAKDKLAAFEAEVSNK